MVQNFLVYVGVIFGRNENTSSEDIKFSFLEVVEFTFPPKTI